MVAPGYKQTEVGVIPEDWERTSLGALGSTFGGLTGKTKVDFGHGAARYITFMNVMTNVVIDCGTFENVDVAPTETQNHVSQGDLFFNGSSETPEEVGMCAVLVDRVEDVFLNSFCFGFRLRPDTQAHGMYLAYYFRSGAGRALLHSMAQGSTRYNLSKIALLGLRFPLPPFAEQEAIAEALSDAEALIESIEQLLAKKRQLKQGAMQELLTGRRRLPGFSGDWNVKRIADIASPSTDTNSAGEDMTVLTCSKHLGFVPSLSYFKNQVFSRDTSGYKIIRRGQIGYPSNHIEEGSIGLQDLYDTAIVSPIYVVFSVTEEVNSYFLHRLLKLDSYRQEFAKATSSSVDRRGSLRWPALAEIIVRLPRVGEQNAVAEVLNDIEAEIAALEAKLGKARAVKEGMMQELLTGRIRLV